MVSVILGDVMFRFVTNSAAVCDPVEVEGSVVVVVVIVVMVVVFSVFSVVVSVRVERELHI